jgi:hypothetical protein
MHIAYNAIKTKEHTKEKSNTIQKKYQAYTQICAKYANEIAAIQKYIPGWQPTFNY